MVKVTLQNLGATVRERRGKAWATGGFRRSWHERPNSVQNRIRQDA